MQWIDEMLSSTKENDVETSETRRKKHAKAGAAESSDKPSSVGKVAWAELISVIGRDVNEFNSKCPAGHSPVMMSNRETSLKKLQFEVYVPGMRGKLLGLTLTGNNLHILVRPEYPDQQSTITLEPGKDSQPYRWMLGGVGAAGREVSVQQLSEYLLKPILVSD